MRTDERLGALMDHLGIATAHFATQMAGDVADLASTRPERIGGLVLCVPSRLDPAPFEGLAAKLLMISGDAGLSAGTTQRALERLPQARRHVLSGYRTDVWSDAVADRTAEIAGTISKFLTALPASSQPKLSAGSGSHAGISYSIAGSGPPLMLLPFFLAPSQWEPALAEFSRNFTVITLGGAYLGGVAALEDRASAPTWQAMLRTLVDLAVPAPTSRVLDVGCGSGTLSRLLAERLGPAAHIDAVDVNPFLLREAAALAADFGERIRFASGSATKLPFADQTFDAVLSVTVLEECDADQAIREMLRVARPGARIAIAVRAIDLPQWWNLDLPPAIKAKAELPAQSVGAGGVADASLYTRMRRAGLIDLVGFPTLVTLDNPEGPIWRYREDHVLSQLSPDETAVWHAARAAAQQQGPLLQAHTLHCAVGTKP